MPLFLLQAGLCLLPWTPAALCVSVSLSLLGEGLGMGPADRYQTGGKNKGNCEWSEGSLLLKWGFRRVAAYCFSPVGGAVTY